MPEGDTLHRLATAMAPKLEGERVERVELEQVELTSLRGRTVESVRALGKHLLIRVGDAYLRSHLGLHGSWHRYPAGVDWKRPKWQASMTLSTIAQAFVCFHAREVDCVRASRMGLYRPLRKLGPDLLGDPIDFAEIVRRARVPAEGDLVANVLLDQTIASGVGNVYKNEVLFLTGVHPTTAIGSLSDDVLIAIYRVARDQMRGNVTRAHRSTTGSSIHRLWVYGRAGRACFRCESAIGYARLSGRSTYWCPGCQPEARDMGDLASASASWRAR